MGYDRSRWNVFGFGSLTKRKEQPRRPDGAYATERVSTALQMAREMGNDKLVKRLEALL